MKGDNSGTVEGWRKPAGHRDRREVECAFRDRRRRRCDRDNVNMASASDAIILGSTCALRAGH